MKSCVFNFDLNMDLDPVSGTLTFYEDGTIVREIEGCPAYSISLKTLEEVIVRGGVGCALMYVKQKEGAGSSHDIILCRFTMSCLKKAGDFCKILNYHIQKDKAAELNATDSEPFIPADFPPEKEKQFCEKCRRPLIDEIKVCVFCYDKLSVLLRAISYLKPYTSKIVNSQILLIVSTVLYLLIPLVNRFLIDNHLEPGTGSLSQIAVLGGAMLLARALGEIMFVISSRVYNSAAMVYCNDLRVMAYDKLQSHSMSSFAKRTPGDLIRRIMDDTASIKDFVTDLGRWAIEQILTFVVVLAILFFTDWRLTLLTFVPVPFVMFFLSRFWLYIRARFERQWRKNSRCSSILHDIIRGIRTVKAFGNEKAEINKFAAANRDFAQISSDNEVIWAKLFPLLNFVTGLGEFMILIFGGYAVINGSMSLGVMVQFLMYAAYIYGPLRWLVSFPRWFANATTSMVKVFELFDEEAEITEQEKPNNVPVTGELSFENVTFGYKSYEPVLKGINLKIKPGEMIGIVGRSGAGKSTMINLLMRLYDVNTGGIRINGTDLREISPNYLHEKTGVVFQDSFLFAGSFFDNIVYAKPGASLDEVIAASKAANAHDFIMKSDDAYNTLIGEGGESLSGGERQRLSIARAIIKNPDILILDEATSSLDVENELAIQESLGRLVKGRTTIAIAHRLSTLRNADRLVVLDKGMIAEAGTHAELLAKKGIYYNLVMAQRQSSRKEDSEVSQN